MARPIVYIAGPMSNIPGHNFPLFDKAKRLLERQNYVVISPADISRKLLGIDSKYVLEPGDPLLKDFNYSVAMANDLPAVAKADVICFLPGWSKSSGTDIERYVATKLQKSFVYYDPRFDILEPHPITTDDQEAAHYSVTKEADALVSGTRRNDYGHPLDNWELTAQIATPIILEEIRRFGRVRAEGMLLVMQAVKIARELNHVKRDNAVDGAGYWKCLDMVNRERETRQRPALSEEFATVSCRCSDVVVEVPVKKAGGKKRAR